MKIQEFLKTLKFSDKLIKLGGFEYLLEKWEDIVLHIPYSKKYQYDDYLHDISIRETILQFQENCEIDQIVLDRIYKADSIFKSKTIEVNYLWSKGLEKSNKEKEWFCYRVPPERICDWYSIKSEEMKIYFEWVKNQSEVSRK
ncbi:hypothetical protein [Breznakiella homolactica]|uniref:Uncharacterized protein n=1 Tax=Breznakiella homolactica TaxID=2798577 RepID=A0A7T7XQR3_9SPIR|nr:hypothetical protein [Breznakiella homolactica]QQO10754.1 hypothetical protein JFL75_07515 [Breznakiella homolactica]